MNDKDFEKSMKKLGFDESHWDSSFGCFFMVIMMFGSSGRFKSWRSLIIGEAQWCVSPLFLKFISYIIKL